MNEYDWIRRFYEIKNEIFSSYGLVPMVSPEDFEELAELTEPEVVKVRRRLKTALVFIEKSNDQELCAWCILNDDGCEDCEYGKRHGIYKNCISNRCFSNQ